MIAGLFDWLHRRNMPTLLIFETNILMDIWLSRDGGEAVLLLGLAEQKRVDLVVPEFVLTEFQGTAHRWVRDERARLNESVRKPANEWARSASANLDHGADDLQRAAAKVDSALVTLAKDIPVVRARIEACARVTAHTHDLHFLGDLRFLRGDPPGRPRDSIQDCRVYEAVLDIVRADAKNARPARIFVTRDSDFTKYPVLTDELAALAVTMRGDSGAIYRELR